MTELADELLPTQEHSVPDCELPAPPSDALFLPEVLFEIGSYLPRQELWSSSLVCVAWHKVFSPFLSWMTLHRGHFLNASQSGSSEGRGGEIQREPLFLDALLERIDRPDADFDFHRARNVYLLCSVIECNDYFSNSTEDSDGNGKARSPRLDWLYIMVVEKSTRLEWLNLNPHHTNNNNNNNRCYRWSSHLQIKCRVDSQACGAGNSLGSADSLDQQGSTGLTGPLSMTYLRPSTPHWPRLRKVSLEGCRVDHSFLRVLLSNAPVLEILSIEHVVILEPETLETAEMDDSAIQTTTSERSDKEENKAAMEGMMSTCIGSSQLSSLVVVNTAGLNMEDVFRFAKQFRLANFVFIPLLVQEAKHAAVSGGRSPSISGALLFGSVVLVNLPCARVAFIAENIPELLQLELSEMPLDRSLIQSLGPIHSQRLWRVCISKCVLKERDHVLHLLLCSLPSLRKFNASETPMVCDPSVLLQTPWVCSGLQELCLVPKCNGSSKYSAEEAQKAFMTQVGSLQRLTRLHLAERRVDSLANGFAPAASLGLLRNLSELEEANFGFSPEARLYTGDAEMMLQSWPRLDVLHLVRSEGNRTFVEYMKEHAPKVKLKRSG